MPKETPNHSKVGGLSGTRINFSSSALCIIQVRRKSQARQQDSLLCVLMFEQRKYIPFGCKFSCKGIFSVFPHHV